MHPSLRARPVDARIASHATAGTSGVTCSAFASCRALYSGFWASGNRRNWAAAVDHCRRRGHLVRLASNGRSVAVQQQLPPEEGQQQQPASVITVEEVQEIARSRGLEVSVKELGPAYRVACRDRASGRVLGVTSGFIVPLLGLMHCDTLQVAPGGSGKVLLPRHCGALKVFTRGLGGEEGERVRRSPLGLGLLLGAAAFAHGARRGCHKAEILAIDDDEAWHQRLVRYYKHFGFEPVVRVSGGRLADLPHMLVWGGAGTRMDADIPTMLRRWTPAVRAAAARAERQSKSSSDRGSRSSRGPEP